MGDETQKTRREIDFDDLQNEFAGREVGRIKRFLSEEVWEEAKGSGAKSKKDSISKLQMWLLSNPNYAKFFQRVEKTLDNVEKAMEQARQNTERTIKLARQKLTVIQDRNSKEYLQAKTTLEKALQDQQALELYRQDTIVHARERLEDHNNPPTNQELSEILADIDSKKPAILKNFSQSSELENSLKISAAKSLADDKGMNAPAMSAHFDLARGEIPEFEPELIPERTYEATEQPKFD